MPHKIFCAPPDINKWIASVNYKEVNRLDDQELGGGHNRQIVLVSWLTVIMRICLANILSVGIINITPSLF